MGTIVGLCVRTSKAVPPEERSELTIDGDVGVHDDHGESKKRQVTIISKESWSDTEGDLDESVPWTTRRANVLVEGLDLSTLLVGGTLQLGECTVKIIGETFPCDLMDRLRPGLKDALLPETRGGVYGRVVNEGTIRVGDPALIANAGAKKALP